MKAVIVTYLLAASLTYAAPIDPEAAWEEIIGTAVGLSNAGKYSQAEAAYKKALDLAKGFPKGNPRRAHTWNGLCAVSYELGHADEAEKYCKSALGEDKNSALSDRLNTLNSLHLLVALHLQAGRISAAERTLNMVEEGLADLGPNPPAKLVGIVNYDRAFLSLIIGKLDRAEEGFLKANRAFIRDPEHALLLASTLSHQCALAIQRKRFEDAERHANEAIKAVETRFGPNHPSIARDLNHLAVIYLQTGRAREAEAPLQRGLPLLEAAFGPEDESVASMQSTYARVLRALGRKSEAKRMQKSADVITQNLETRRPSGKYTIDVKSLSYRK